MTVIIERLTVVYQNGLHGIEALDDFSLSLIPGRIMALVGESGSGKTTLAKALMGLLPDSALVSGSARFDGQELLSLDEKELNHYRWSKMAMVFQQGEQNFNPVVRIVDQVAEPLIQRTGASKKEALKKAFDVIKNMGLGQEQGRRFPHELSGGQLQRALLAMALILDPKVLLLDEPTASLDAMTKSFVSGLIQGARDRGQAVLLITHDLELARNLADDLTVLYMGQIMETMPALDLLASPGHPYTRALVRSFPDMAATRDLGGIRGDAFFRIQHIHGENVPSHSHLKTPDNEHRDDHGWPGGCLFRSRCTQVARDCDQGSIPLTRAGDHQVRCLRGGLIKMLELQGVSKTYGRVTALYPNEVDILAGDVFCLVGETGSGKTTLGQVAAGVIKPDGGRRILDGRDMDEWIRADYRSLARRIGLIYQNPAESVSHRFTVYDLVAEPLVIQGQDKDKEQTRTKVCKVLSEVHLSTEESFLKRYPHELNMGAIQRVCLARALILGPSLLIADEPTSALDPSVQAKVLKMLLNLQIEKGLTMIFITHDIGLARKIGDCIGVMSAGRLVEVGPASAVINRPLHPYTRTLLESAAGRLTTHLKIENDRTAACSFAHRCDRAGQVCFQEVPAPIRRDGRRVICHRPLDQSYTEPSDIKLIAV